MSEYLIISGTNRKDSHTEIVANEYLRFLTNKSISASILSLKDLNVLERNEGFLKVEAKFLIPADKFIFILPEYNGSYPGVVKAMIDISDVKKCFWWKKALLTGVSTGRAGNLRGMDQITGCLNHIKVFVHPNKLPLSVIDTILNEKKVFADEGHTFKAIDQQIEEFIKF